MSPLRCASLTAGMLHSVETALAEVYENAPIVSQIVRFLEAAGTGLNELGAGFRGNGRLLLLPLSWPKRHRRSWAAV
mgnify:FL=1